ncbi:MAG: DUF1934 family protein [Clostridiales bacterium]|nr:DUF1934 family protein [Clostridiales bacterium]
MKKQAKIYVLEKNDDYSAIFSGTVEDTSTGYYIEYEEEEGTSCLIGFSKGIASVTRTKDPIYTVILEENCPHAFDIVTPFGKIEAVAHPVTVRSRTKGNTRTITLVYDLMLGKEKFRHELKLKIEIEE